MSDKNVEVIMGSQFNKLKKASEKAIKEAAKDLDSPSDEDIKILKESGSNSYANAVEKKYHELVKERDDKKQRLNEQQKLILDRAIKNVQMKLKSLKGEK